LIDAQRVARRKLASLPPSCEEGERCDGVGSLAAKAEQPTKLSGLQIEG
jgi:hypothetical protein